MALSLKAIFPDNLRHTYVYNMSVYIAFFSRNVLKTSCPLRFNSKLVELSEREQVANTKTPKHSPL